MKSLDPIELLRVCVGESAAWASLPLTSTVPVGCVTASCSRGNELDDTGRRGNENLTGCIIIWLLLNSVWGGHKAEPHRLLTSISTGVMCSSSLARFPFFQVLEQGVSPGAWLWDPSNSTCISKCRACISHLCFPEASLCVLLTFTVSRLE